MGLLGAMGGGGEQISNIGGAMFQSAMEEERSMRIAEYKSREEAAAAETKFAREKELMEREAEIKAGEPVKLGTSERLVDRRTNKVIIDADPAGKAGGGSVSSHIQLAEYLKRDPRYKDLGEGELVEIAKASYSDPVSAASALLSKDYDYLDADPETKAKMFSGTLKMFTEARRGAYGIGGKPEPTSQPAAAAPTPPDIPKGSKQIGTSGGKPVYEAPDGKRYIVE